MASGSLNAVNQAARTEKMYLSNPVGIQEPRKKTRQTIVGPLRLSMNCREFGLSINPNTAKAPTTEIPPTQLGVDEAIE
jgi:hypothetical protein